MQQIAPLPQGVVAAAQSLVITKAFVHSRPLRAVVVQSNNRPATICTRADFAFLESEYEQRHQREAHKSETKMRATLSRASAKVGARRRSYMQSKFTQQCVFARSQFA
jgi:hypothetical protein